MALKTKITAEAHKELPEALQEYYKQSGEGYILDLDGIDDHPDVQGLKAKNGQLMDETKAEREKRQALEEAQAAAEQQRAQEKGEFKELYEKTQTELETERENARKYRQSIQEGELKAASQALASELTRDTARASLLQQEANKYARYTDQGVVFEIGGVAADKDKLLDKLRTDYPFLVDGTQASGGGAAGSTKGGGATKKLKDMSEAERLKLKQDDPDQFKRLMKG